MKARNSSVLASTSKIMTAAALSVLLVACGGGTSGDVLDGDLDPDPDFSDLDNELEGNNIDDLGDEEIIVVVDPTDANDNGIADAAEDLVCKGLGGSDPDSSNSPWQDNCVLDSFLSNAAGTGFVNGPFFKSTYVQGVQRILACREHAGVGISDTASIDAWSDGTFAEKTVEAVREFQEAEGLLVDGRVNDETWGKLQDYVFDANNQVADNSDSVFNAYGVSRVASPATNIDCSQVSSFYGRFATEGDDLFSGWQLATEHGSFSIGSFSIDPVQ